MDINNKKDLQKLSEFMVYISGGECPSDYINNCNIVCDGKTNKTTEDCVGCWRKILEKCRNS